MLRRRPASERGIYDYVWLKTAHTFSFNEYHDPAHHKFRALRVMNEDHVAPGQGFGLHPHRDMEIVTVVLSGTLAHEDSLGHRQTLGRMKCNGCRPAAGFVTASSITRATSRCTCIRFGSCRATRIWKPAYDQRVFRRGRAAEPLAVARCASEWRVKRGAADPARRAGHAHDAEWRS